MPLPPRRPRYNTVANSDDDNDIEAVSVATTTRSRAAPPRRGTPPVGAYASVASHEAPAAVTSDATTSVTVTILDFCHKRWNVTLPADATVLELKQAGSAVHSVAVSQQRLIYHGKLLSDETKLDAANITTDSIVHLFPKPRVVVVNNTSETATTSEAQNNNEESGGGARVPTIVMDQAEADRRGQILVLGSMDYIEAVNNVKLFSFMLLIISSIELLNLTAIAMGNGDAVAAPADPYSDAIPFVEHDDYFPDDDAAAFNSTTASNSTNMVDPALAIYQTWTRLSYVDVAISVIGVYVAVLGIKASNENCIATARLYLTGTCITAVAWLVYNYIISLEVDEAIAAEMQQDATNNSNDNEGYGGNNYDSSDSVYDQAFQVMVLPAMVWCLCIFRAWQFQHLLQEAEVEAAERIAAEEANAVNDDDEEQLATTTTQQQQHLTATIT